MTKHRLERMYLRININYYFDRNISLINSYYNFKDRVV